MPLSTRLTLSERNGKVKVPELRQLKSRESLLQGSQLKKIGKLASVEARRRTVAN